MRGSGEKKSSGDKGYGKKQKLLQAQLQAESQAELQAQLQAQFKKNKQAERKAFAAELKEQKAHVGGYYTATQAFNRKQSKMQEKKEFDDRQKELARKARELAARFRESVNNVVDEAYGEEAKSSPTSKTSPLQSLSSNTKRRRKTWFEDDNDTDTFGTFNADDFLIGGTSPQFNMGALANVQPQSALESVLQNVSQQNVLPDFGMGNFIEDPQYSLFQQNIPNVNRSINFGESNFLNFFSLINNNTFIFTKEK
jgi:hypothetical protein